MRPRPHQIGPASNEYKINDEIKSGAFVFRCAGSAVTSKGKSGSSVTWDYTTGNETGDNNIIWECGGTATGNEADWAANCVYSKNDQVKSGGYVFTCARVRGLSASSNPTFNCQYGGITTDGDFSWKCVSPEPAVMNYLRAAFFMPRVTTTQKGVRRFMALRSDDDGDGVTTTSTDTDNSVTFSDSSFFSSIDAEESEWTAYNQVVLKKLAPGSRKLYVYGFFKNGTEYRNKRGSGVLDVKLSPGVNRITVYLTNEL